MAIRVNKAKEIVQSMLETGLRAPELRRAIMLWGPPGVGKTSIIHSAAEELGADCTDIRLLLYKPTDLTGYPVLDRETNRARFAKPAFIPDDDKERPTILFFDEITSAPPSVQAAAYQPANDYAIGEHVFPPNVQVVFAGNRTTDRGVAYNMPSPLANRMVHLELEASLEDWKEWALNHGIHPYVIGFLNFRPELLYVFPETASFQGFPTPRTWEMASNFLASANDPEDIEEILIGTIGEGAAIEFLSFLRLADRVPDAKKILEGDFEAPEKSPDILYALAGSLVYQLQRSGAKKKVVDHFMDYLIQFLPAEFATLAMKDAMQTKAHTKIISSPMFPKWAEQNQAVLL